MTQENKAILIKRFKSFVWRLGGLVLSAVLNFAGGQLGLFNMPPEVVAVVGLVIGEITKQLNTPKK